jgi:hypothetical protein
LDGCDGNLCECNHFGAESWEGQLNNDNNSNDKIPQPAVAKKPYKTPTMRFESVFEVSALACGKLTTTQSGCKFSTKAS